MVASPLTRATEPKPNPAANAGAPAIAKRVFYRPELDALRLFAFVLVFLHHGLGSGGAAFEAAKEAGALGVCVFFLLSSFLITELMEREVAVSGTVHLRQFFVRRMLRIWPLYFAILGVDALIHLHRPGAFTAGRLTAFLLLAGNWYVAAHGFSFTVSTPLWSISIEEQFYLLWPATRKLLGRVASFTLSASAIGGAYVALAVLCAYHAEADTRIWVNSFVQFQFFGSGALVALLLRGRAPTWSVAVRLLTFAAAIGLLYVAQAVFAVKASNGPAIFSRIASGYLCANAGCVLLLLSFLGARAWVRAKVVLYLGRISYGLYVYHWICLRVALHVMSRGRWVHAHATASQVAALLLAFSMTVCVAAVSYRLFEQPILRFKRRFEFVSTRPVVVPLDEPILR